ncbi:MAG: dTDP-4-dehydrorhamnose 3,5-epimerase [Granulosicoccaceae bacterium]
MQFEATPLAGAYLINSEPRSDDRGAFGRTFCVDEFSEAGLNTSWQQANVASNVSSGIVRGMHYQTAPHAEVKLINCIKGRVFDVIVDVREGSPTRYQWFAAMLEASDNKQMYVPEGFAHGYQVLEAGSSIHYLVSAAYAPQSEAGLRWDDPKLAIAWPIKSEIQLSDKDKLWPLLD